MKKYVCYDCGNAGQTDEKCIIESDQGHPIMCPYTSEAAHWVEWLEEPEQETIELNGPRTATESVQLIPCPIQIYD